MVSLVVLVAVIACAVATASVAAWSAAQAQVADARGRRATGVNLALSGVDAVVMEVAKQRPELLRGQGLTLTAHGVVWTGTDAGGVPQSGVVRLMALGAQGVTFQHEAAKLDVNETSEERLKNLGVLTSEALGKVVAGRGARAGGSVWEILAVETAETVLPAAAVPAPAPAAAAPPASDAPKSSSAGASAAPAGAGAAGEGGAPSADAPKEVSKWDRTAWDAGVPKEEEEEAEVVPRDMLSASDYLTCYSADPQARSGFGADGAIDPDATGAARLVLPETWSADFEKVLAVEVGAEPAAWLGRQYSANRRPTSASALAASAGTDPVMIAGVLDAVEFDEAGARRGLADLMSAPAEVLSGVPGIAPGLADRIVAAREKLEASRRATALWPVLEGLVDMNEFAPALDLVTSRSLVFRVIVEGGVVSGELRGEAADWVLKDRWAYEAIIDASEMPVRIAYLRAATFDALIVPGAKEPDPPRAAPAKASEETPEAERPVEPVAGADVSEQPPTSPTAPEAGSEGDDASKREPESSMLPRGGSGTGEVDSPKPGGAGGSSSGPSSPATPVRSRIGRWTGGGGGRGGGGSGSGSGGRAK